MPNMKLNYERPRPQVICMRTADSVWVDMISVLYPPFALLNFAAPISTTERWL